MVRCGATVRSAVTFTSVEVPTSKPALTTVRPSASASERISTEKFAPESRM